MLVKSRIAGAQPLRMPVAVAFDPERVANLVAAVGTPDFGTNLLEVIDPDVEAAHCVAFQFEGEGSFPRCVFSSSRVPGFNSFGDKLAEEYSTEFFKFDPVFQELNKTSSSVPSVNFFDIRRLVSSRNTNQSAYVEKFYRLTEKSDQADFNVRMGDRMLWVSLYKYPGSKEFSNAMRERLKTLSPFVLSSAARQADLQPHRGDNETVSAVARESVPGDDAQEMPVLWDESRARLLAKIRFALLRDAVGLSYREADVCAQIVLGFTALGISLNLDISINTVATHRKRAYAKLGISSQTELFSVCLRNHLI